MSQHRSIRDNQQWQGRYFRALEVGLISLLSTSLSIQQTPTSMTTKKTSGKFFSEDSYSVRIQPKTVLIISLIFIGLVVLLHIYSKIGVPTKAVDTPIPKPPHQQQPQTTDDL